MKLRLIRDSVHIEGKAIEIKAGKIAVDRGNVAVSGQFPGAARIHMHIHRSAVLDRSGKHGIRQIQGQGGDRVHGDCSGQGLI